MEKYLITVHTKSDETKLLDTVISASKWKRYVKYILSSSKTNKERLLETLPIFEFKS